MTAKQRATACSTPTRVNNMAENWDNKEPIGIRTKLALRVLLLIFKILSPYQFEHRFSKDLSALEADINGLGKEAKK